MRSVFWFCLWTRFSDNSGGGGGWCWWSQGRSEQYNAPPHTPAHTVSSACEGTWGGNKRRHSPASAVVGRTDAADCVIVLWTKRRTEVNTFSLDLWTPHGFITAEWRSGLMTLCELLSSDSQPGFLLTGVTSRSSGLISVSINPQRLTSDVQGQMCSCSLFNTTDK